MSTAGSQTNEIVWPRCPALFFEIGGLAMASRPFGNPGHRKNSLRAFRDQSTGDDLPHSGGLSRSQSSSLSIHDTQKPHLPTDPHPVTCVSLASFHACSSWNPGTPWSSWTTDAMVGVRAELDGSSYLIPHAHHRTKDLTC